MQTLHEILTRGDERRHLLEGAVCYVVVVGLVGLFFFFTAVHHGLGEKSRGGSVVTVPGESAGGSD